MQPKNRCPTFASAARKAAHERKARRQRLCLYGMYVSRAAQATYRVGYSGVGRTATNTPGILASFLIGIEDSLVGKEKISGAKNGDRPTAKSTCNVIFRFSKRNLYVGMYSFQHSTKMLYISTIPQTTLHSCIRTCLFVAHRLLRCSRSTKIGNFQTLLDLGRYASCILSNRPTSLHLN